MIHRVPFNPRAAGGSGGFVTDVAQTLGILVERLIKHLRSGESDLLPHRLMSTDLRGRYGWASSTVSVLPRERAASAGRPRRSVRVLVGGEH